MDKMENISIQIQLDYFLKNKRNVELYRKTKLIWNSHLRYKLFDENIKDELILKTIDDFVFSILQNIFILNKPVSRPSKTVKWIKSQWMNYDEIILEFVKELVLDCLEDDGRFPKENFDLTYIKEEISAMNFSNLREATRIDSHFLDYLDESLPIDLFIDAFVHVNGYTMNGEEILEERKKEYEKAMFKYSKKSDKKLFFEAAPEPPKNEAVEGDEDKQNKHKQGPEIDFLNEKLDEIYDILEKYFADTNDKNKLKDLVYGHAIEGRINCNSYANRFCADIWVLIEISILTNEKSIVSEWIQKYFKFKNKIIKISTIKRALEEKLERQNQIISLSIQSKFQSEIVATIERNKR